MNLKCTPSQLESDLQTRLLLSAQGWFEPAKVSIEQRRSLNQFGQPGRLNEYFNPYLQKSYQKIVKTTPLDGKTLRKIDEIVNNT